MASDDDNEPIVIYKRRANRAFENAYREALDHTLRRARRITDRGAALGAAPEVVKRSLKDWKASTRRAEGVHRPTMRARSSMERTQERVRSSIDHAVRTADRIGRDTEELRKLATAAENASNARERKRLRSVARTVARRIELALETLPTIDLASLPRAPMPTHGRTDGIDRALWVLETLGDDALPMLAERARRDAIRWARALRSVRVQREIRRTFDPKDADGRPINACRVPGPIVLDDRPEAALEDALAYD